MKNNKISKLKLYEKPFVFSVLFNMFFFALFYLIFTPRFATNDDVGMMFNISGAIDGAVANEYVIFTNIIITKTLKALYSLPINIPWYELYLIAGLFISFSILLYLLIKKHKSWIYFGLYVCFMMILSAHILRMLQFTISSIMLVLSGILFFIESFRENKKAYLKFFAASLIILFGCLMRLESIYIFLVFATSIIIAYLLGKNITTRQSLYAFMFSITVFAVGFGVLKFHEHLYSTNPKLQNINKHIKVLRTINDYKILKSDKTLTKKLGWSKNDFTMMEGYFMFMDSIYSFERLKNIPKAKVFTLSTQKTINSLREIFELGTSVNFILVYSFLFVIFLLSIKKLKQLLTPALLLGASFGLFFLLSLFLKPPPYRVHFPILVFCAFYALYFMPKTKRGKLFLPTIILAILLSLGSLFKNFQSSTRYQNKFNSIEKYIKQQPKEKIFVNLGYTFPLNYWLPFSNLKTLNNFKIVSLGAFQILPTFKTQLSNYKINNLYKAIYTNSNVYVVLQGQGFIKSYIEFMEQHYGIKNIGVELVEQTEMFIIAKFYNKKPAKRN